MGACARNMQSDPAEIKLAQCCIKLVFHLTYVAYMLPCVMKTVVLTHKLVLQYVFKHFVMSSLKFQNQYGPTYT